MECAMFFQSHERNGLNYFHRAPIKLTVCSLNCSGSFDVDEMCGRNGISIYDTTPLSNPAFRGAMEQNWNDQNAVRTF